jgi:hypothetical protein
MKRVLCSMLALAILIDASAAAPAVAAPGDARSDQAVVAGLAYLARQQADDGAFSRDAQRLPDTAAALLAFLSAGHVPDLGRYGLTVRRALELLLSSSPDGRYGPDFRAHAIVTLALIEASTVEPDPHQRQRLTNAISAAINLLTSAQAPAGGWADSGDSSADRSSTRWALLTLSAAREIGIEVPEPTFERGNAFLRGLPNAPVRTAEDAWFQILASTGSLDVRVRNTQRLLDQQQPDGSWPADDAIRTSTQATALSLMTFTSRLHNLKTIRE